MISLELAGSRLPVGSSHNNIAGLLTSALAIAILCCSPPDNSLGKALYLSRSPTMESIASTLDLIFLLGASTTFCANAIFSYTFLSGNRRKSWNTTPISLLRYGSFFLVILFKYFLLTYILPDVGSNSLSNSLIRVDLPEPLLPTINTNSPFWM